jgi:hypothetical protein
MGKWIARLEVDFPHPLPEAPAKTLETPPERVASVLSVGSGKGSANSAPIEPGPGLSTVACTDTDVARFLDRRARLLRWGWAEPDADALAERLVRRDREADPRVSCADCQHYRPGRCGNHRRAGLGSDEVGRDLAGLLQRCDGFVSWRDWR